MARSKSISIPITGNSAPLRKELKKASQELSAFGKAQAKWAQASTLAYGVVGGAAAQFAISSVKAALDDQKSQALLAQQLRATTGARAAQVAGVENYIEQTMLATNITDDALRPALAQLVRVTGSAAEAQKLLTIATDVSVGSGRELGSVVTALGRAYNGNYASLSKLGIQIDTAAASSRGFVAVTDQLAASFGGSAKAAADTLAGRVENLSVRFGELKETLGTALFPIVDEATAKLLDLAKAADSKNPIDLAKSVYNIGESIGNLGQTITGVNLVKKLSPIRWAVGWLSRDTESLSDKYEKLSGVLVAGAATYKNTATYLDDQAEAAAKADREIGYLRDQYRSLSDVLLKLADDEKKRKEAAQNASNEAAANYREEAAALRGSLTAALKDARKNLKDARADADDFGRSLAFSFGVSLAGAYDKANQSEDDYTAALEDRKKAYAALDVAKQGRDLNDYLKAIEDVAAAEQAVTTAQKARITPASAFGAQIEAAKAFGSNLKALIDQGLGQAGLQQLLDLGPAAGAEVTKALLEGTAGFTVGGLNQSLEDLASVQAGLAAGITSSLAPKGAINAAQAQIDALSSASISAPGAGRGIIININAGVGDPVAIGRQVKQILADYDTRAGSLVVQGPKKKRR